MEARITVVKEKLVGTHERLVGQKEEHKGVRSTQEPIRVFIRSSLSRKD